MGAGKTTIGRELARLLARPLIDNDEQVREATGRAVAAISREPDGVAQMRGLESEALARALSASEPAVITAAAGVVLDETMRNRLREPFVVWLRAQTDTLAARVARDPARPLLSDDPVATLRAMEQQRHHLYARVADLVVDVDRRSPAAVAERIAAAVPLGG